MFAKRFQKVHVICLLFTLWTLSSFLFLRGVFIHVANHDPLSTHAEMSQEDFFMESIL